MMEIVISRDYSKSPGGRYIQEGKYSGEDFRKNVLSKAYEKAKEEREKLRIVLDGGYGYGSSFLEEAFGGMVRDGYDITPDTFEIISDEEPKLIADIREYIGNALKDRKK